MTSSVIYYSTDARKNEIYLLNTIDFNIVGNGLDLPPAVQKKKKRKTTVNLKKFRIRYQWNFNRRL